MKQKLTVVPLVILSLLLSACDRRTILGNIESALVLALTAASVSGEVPPEFRKFVDGALAGIACQSAEGATNDSAALKSVKMAACLLGVAEPLFPPGTSQDIITKAHNLAVALRTILASLPPPQAVRAQNAPQGPPDVVSAEDKAKADSMKQRAEEGLKKWRGRAQ